MENWLKTGTLSGKKRQAAAFPSSETAGPAACATDSINLANNNNSQGDVSDEIDENENKKPTTTVSTSLADQSDSFIKDCCDNSKTSKRAKISLHDCFEKIGDTGRKMVRCKVCFSQPRVVNIHRKSNQIPPICTAEGSQIRQAIMDAHLNSTMHAEALKACRLSRLSTADLITENTIERAVARKNEELLKKVGAQICTVFNDAKRGTLSAWSWPSREIAYMKGENFKLHGFSGKFEPTIENLQYLFPAHHADLLQCIVDTNKPQIKNQLNNSLAISLRVDGSVDRSQIHNNHIMANVINKDGSESLLFLGFSETKTRGATGYLQSLKDATERLISWDELLSKTSSIVTDGENLNTGEAGGLWALMQAERDKSSSNLPLLKIWCAAHRINLAWKSVTQTVIEVRSLIQTSASLCTYFHTSGHRTAEIKAIASENNLKYLHYPNYFEVRWTEFSCHLIEVILRNWQSCILYFKKYQNESEETGHLKFWLTKDNIHLACVLADILYLYKRFQKSFQDDGVTLFDIQAKKENVITKFRAIMATPLVGGFEELFQNTIVTHGDQISFHGHELNDKRRRSETHNKYTSDKREFTAVRNDTINAVINFLQNRMERDVSFCSSISPINKLLEKITDDDLRNCHASICPDLELREFCAEYREASELPNLRECNPVQLLKTVAKYQTYPALTVALARVVAAKPHSADVERLISAYNKIKTEDRSLLSESTLQNTLYISINMDSLDVFDPTPAAIRWIHDKNRRSRPVDKAKCQEWYKGVFEDAEKYHKDDKWDESIQQPNLYF